MSSYPELASTVFYFVCRANAAKNVVDVANVVKQMEVGKVVDSVNVQNVVKRGSLWSGVILNPLVPFLF